MKVLMFTAALLLCFRENFGQTNFGQTADLGPGITLYRLKVQEDVTLDRGSTNFNYLQYLITGYHPGYPKKRSLLRFQNVPSKCKSVNHAMMYIYYVYSHKDSFQTAVQAPFITRTIRAHRVLKPWMETSATSTKRDPYNNWQTQWLGLNDIDATSSYTGQTTIYASRPRGFVEIEVTDAVRAWKSGFPNYGIVIWATNEHVPGRDTRFSSKANRNRDPTRNAYIIVNCDNRSSGMGRQEGSGTLGSADAIQPFEAG